MDWPMFFVFFLLGIMIIAFIREWATPDVVAMAGFCSLFVIGILTVEEAISVFNNSAPITIACMFILTSALQKTGVIDSIARILQNHLGNRIQVILFFMMLLAGVCSAFVNNTPIVALFMPILLSLGRVHQIPASKFLIPLSYASILGGTCTLIGTSTNLLVSGVAREYGLLPIGFFELTWIGLPFFLIGLVYMVTLGPYFLPERRSITSLLAPEDRRQFLCQVLVKGESPLVGQMLLETAFAQQKGDFRIIEVRREGRRLLTPLNQIRVKQFDRILISASARQMAELPQVKGVQLATETQGELGIESLSTIQGSIVEGIIAPHSSLMGKTIRSINFRQKYGMLILALHRHGKNLSSNFLDEKLEFGDTLLMLGPNSTFAEMEESGDFMILEDKLPHTFRREKAPFVWAAMAGVVLLASLNLLPIVGAGFLAVLGVLIFRCLDSEEAYQAVDWQIIFLIYGMLGVGVAMQKTGAAQFLASQGIAFLDSLVPVVWLPILALSLCYLLTNGLTEILSNNATAVVMAPVAINCAVALQVDPRPFVIAVTIASSASFLTPIGYQTNTMVYGAGGYKFIDFFKFGLPLSLLYWVLASLWIPMVWPF